MLNGGIPENVITLLSGGSGTGKTVLGLQTSDAIDEGRRVLLVSLEDRWRDVLRTSRLVEFYREEVRESVGSVVERMASSATLRGRVSGLVRLRPAVVGEAFCLSMVYHAAKGLPS